MPTLTAPYNFVPLNETVVRPDWSELISLDLPFKDGLSGRIDIKIESKGPIYIRNSGGKDTDNTAFSTTPDGRYFIPGSSLRGAIRNVLSIMSFGDLGRQMDDVRHSMRDLRYRPYISKFQSAEAGQPKQGYYKYHPDGNRPAVNVYGGWLKCIGENEYEIQGVCKLKAIKQSEIDRNLDTNVFENYKSTKYTSGLNDGKELKSAKSKYEYFATKNLSTVIRGERGTYVFTGQPSAVDKDRAKVSEFIFLDSEVNKTVSKEVMQNFRNAYFEYDPRLQSTDYKYWNNILKTGGRIPVFLHKDPETGEILSFGLSFMYKFPYTFTAKEQTRKVQGTGDPDLSECIFGFTTLDGNKVQNALKSRVSFGHAMAGVEKKPVELGLKTEVLNSPKATYYPTYIRQKVNDAGSINGPQYSTLFDETSRISGWKRYPVHKDGVKSPKKPDNDKLSAKFRPIKNAEFNGTIAFHNLRPMELGALLSALSFHDNKDAYHSLGMAKPLGYGKVKINIEGIKFSGHFNGKFPEADDLMRAFEEYMNTQLGAAWHKSEQITELITMATEQNNRDRSELNYMKEVEDFAKVKNKPKQALDKYTRLTDIKEVQVKSKLIS